MKKNYYSKNSGFTLIEALVAVSILMVAVAAPITIAQKGLSSAVYAKDQMIAAYLAQDAIEYIKNQRDTHSINFSSKWNTLGSENDGPAGFGDCIVDDFTESGCQIDTTELDISAAVEPFNYSSLLIDQANGFYSYNSGTQTKFIRQIQMKLSNLQTTGSVARLDEAVVQVTVFWPGGNSITVPTLIYNY